MDNYIGIIKLLLIGTTNAGKTSLVNRFITNNYKTDYNYTVGLDFNSKILEIDNKRIKLLIWDSSGQYRFFPILTNYYRNINIVLFCFDINDIQSFNETVEWIEKTNNNIEETVDRYLIATKCDLNNNIKAELINELCDKYNLQYYECSSKSGINIQELFETITLKQIKNNKVKKPLVIQKSNRDNFYCTKCSIQ